MKQVKVVLQVVSLVFYISGTLLAADYSGEYYSWDTIKKNTCQEFYGGEVVSGDTINKFEQSGSSITHYIADWSQWKKNGKLFDGIYTVTLEGTVHGNIIKTSYRISGGGSTVKLTCKFKMNGTSSGSGSINMKVSGSLSCKLRAKMELEPASNKYSKSRYELIAIDNDFSKDILADGSLPDIIRELETLMMNTTEESNINMR
ncbi:hypothetical protein [uncultured Candidatus Kuenenia sp.]|uniref:hypothetical protein n=1 Tax=uncultured Candidatus Kuenenia sp. TaxID=1048336 RepID=UPI0002E4D958|nr:hypothetical protein [uncultured Candidatus Kuenenia sp.]